MYNKKDIDDILSEVGTKKEFETKNEIKEWGQWRPKWIGILRVLTCILVQI